MRTHNPPTFCRDCHRAISATATRCVTCARRARIDGGGVVPSARPADVPATRPLSEKETRWIRAEGARLPVEWAAKLLRVDRALVEALRTQDAENQAVAAGASELIQAIEIIRLRGATKPPT